MRANIANLIKYGVLSLFVAVMISACSGKPASDSGKTGSATGVEAKERVTQKSESVAGLPTVIDFYATWCGPCNQISPLFEMLRGEYSDRINFERVDVDIDVEKTERYHIDAMPTFVFLDAEGNEIDRIVGANPVKLSATVEELAGEK